MCPPPSATPDLPPELGVRLTDEGAEFSVYAGHARSVDVCLFETGPDGATTERRVPLRHRAHGTWFDTVPGVVAGQRYAFRVDGEWDPDRSLLHNPAKLLLDPYAPAPPSTRIASGPTCAATSGCVTTATRRRTCHDA
jgi:isoamylase